MNQPNRREVLKWSALLAGTSILPRNLFAAADENKSRPRKVLFFTKSSDFEHDVIKRNGEKLGFAERKLIELGKQHDLDITASKDGQLFEPGKLAELDAIVFYTTGDLTTNGKDKNPPMSAEGKQALLDAVRNGVGFVGIHCASDTFHSRSDRELDPYIQMLGGEFIIHGKQQDSTTRVADPKFPGVPDQKDFTLHEEWYALKNFAEDLHVILLQDTTGMVGDMYQRPPYPSTWARRHGNGRVFYTSMGHREDVWTNPIFQNLLLSGVAWSMGAIDAEVTPNLNSVAPGARKIPTLKPTTTR
ncbi:MAG TPA: ThuA domain-containing protein [Tepidisphaeraceae bacterium]|nr:ThuA domain-containing protein [Tepidisphaeraceae bacterium]